MTKYIIKNCPCYWHIGEDDGCSLENLKECENDSNCIIKQIVELCNEYKNNYCINNGVHLLIGEILNLLEIEEVNE